MFPRGYYALFSAFYIMDLIKMQIPLVESRLALSYSSWFSDSEFAFFVRGFGHALFNYGGILCKTLECQCYGFGLVTY